MISLYWWKLLKPLRSSEIQAVKKFCFKLTNLFKSKKITSKTLCWEPIMALIFVISIFFGKLLVCLKSIEISRSLTNFCIRSAFSICIVFAIFYLLKVCSNLLIGSRKSYNYVINKSCLSLRENIVIYLLPLWKISFSNLLTTHSPEELTLSKFQKPFKLSRNVSVFFYSAAHGMDIKSQGTRKLLLNRNGLTWTFIKFSSEETIVLINVK